MLTVMITLSDHFSLLVSNLSGLWTTSVRLLTHSIWRINPMMKYIQTWVGLSLVTQFYKVSIFSPDFEPDCRLVLRVKDLGLSAALCQNCGLCGGGDGHPLGWQLGVQLGL